MSRATPDQILAHVQLLRSVDELLAQAEAVRESRNALDRALSTSVDQQVVELSQQHHAQAQADELRHLTGRG